MGIGIGRWIRATGIAVIAVGLLGIDGTAAEEPQSAPRAAVACADETSGAARALAMAAACDAEVEIVDKRTETDEFLAQPDGSTTLRRYAVPQRVRRSAGWVDMDADLAFQPDGSVRPKAVPYGLTFSGGGSSPFVAIADGDRTLAQTWPTRLPRPTLDGDTATYAEVLPGVDLQLTATIEGYHQVLVVENRAAAASSELAKIATRVSTTGLTLRDVPGGQLEAVDGQGRKVFFSEASTMWDEPARRQVDGVTVARPRQEAVMGVDVQGDQLVVTPDQAMLQSPTTSFPVSIDPTVYRYSSSNWTTVRSCASTTSYWSSKRDAMRVGADPEQTSCIHRVFVNIPLTDLTGKLIKGSSFFANMDHSSPCGSPTPQVRLAVTTERWITQGNGSVTWANTNDYQRFRAWVVGYASPDSANETWNSSTGRYTCGRDLGDKLVEWGIDPGNFGWFTNRPEYSHITFLIYSTSESGASTWKKFYPDSAYAEVTFNQAPYAPAPHSVSDCTVRCASPAVVSRTDPQLRATASDPDGGNLNLYFTVQKADGTPVVSSPAVAQASGGTPAPWRIQPALPGEGAYRFSVRSCDEWGDCADSGWFDFSVDTTPPPPTRVDPVDPDRYFPEDGSGRSSGGIGVPGQLLLTGDASVDTFTWLLDSGSPVTVPATGTNPSTAVITVTPRTDMVRTLSVTAHDVSGRSTSSTYRFRVTPPDPDAGYWNLNGHALDSRDFTGKPPGTIHHDGTVNGSTWVDVTVPGSVQSPRFRGAYFDGAAASAAITTAQPVLATLRNPDTPEVPRSFSVGAWVRFDGAVTDGRYYTAVSQQGVNKSGFELGYQTYPDSNFCFTMFASDTVGPPATRACVTTPVTTGEWVHLAGVYDDANHTLRVYVHRLNAAGFADFDGMATAELPFTSTWAANGPFTIGRAYNGAPGAPFRGVVDEVYAAQYAAPAEDVQAWATSFEISE